MYLYNADTCTGSVPLVFVSQEFIVSVLIQTNCDLIAASGGINCNFETNFCTWKQVRNTDQFDWTRQAGSTASSSTGPSADHTTGTSEYSLCPLNLECLHLGLFLDRRNTQNRQYIHVLLECIPFPK